MGIKSFEQIAKAMYTAFVSEKQKAAGYQLASWMMLTDSSKLAWIAAAKEAQKQFLEGH